ncbi:MAG: hypothetical protein SVV80_00610 [Planctomycetota bacterium]|nr:hypothetical protein [Planctomycetota bacterium]
MMSATNPIGTNKAVPSKAAVNSAQGGDSVGADGQDVLAVPSHQVEFLPKYIRHQRRRRRRLIRQGYLLVACLVVMGILTCVRAERAAQARNNLAMLEKSSNNLKKHAAKITSLERQMSDLLIRKQINEELGCRTDCTVVLAELCRITPPGIVLVSLDLKTVGVSAEDSEQPSPATGHHDLKPGVVGEKGRKADAEIARRARMVITGLAPNDVDVANFIGQLSASTLLDNVNTDYTRTVVFRGQLVREFQTKCYLAR